MVHLASWRSWAPIAAGLGMVGWTLFRLRRLQARITPEMRADMALAERAEALRQTDPAAADAMVLKHFEARAHAEQAERDHLWTRAPHDRAAAVELRRRLRVDLETHEYARRTVERERPASPDAARVLGGIERETAATRSALARVDTLLHRHDER